MESTSRKIHRVVIEWDAEFELAIVSAECRCEHCTDLQESIAEFLDVDEITIEGVSDGTSVDERVL